MALGGTLAPAPTRTPPATTATPQPSLPSGGAPTRARRRACLYPVLGAEMRVNAGRKMTEFFVQKDGAQSRRIC